ncbi:MAG TPA: 8-amino-7-oxononanoate synthase [Mycobacteriales bacterium]|nr:8-amino-7-oxononanoate synthase [Mycobacteriales bacterium]
MREQGLQRSLSVAPDGVLDLASNDYLGLSRHPLVVDAAAQAARRLGAGATGSRLVTGTTEAHVALETALAERTGAEAALVFSSGYLANLGAVTTLAGPDVLVVSDAANHASLVDACRLSRARVEVVPHRDVGAVAQALDAHPGRAVVVTDAVFSVDGSLAPLAALHDAARAAGALLLVDEAHGLGVLGPGGAGACAAAGLDGEPDVVRTVTLSKALGAQGGAVLGPAALRDHLVDTCRTFIFDTGLAPPAAAAALAALGLVTDERVAALTAAGSALSSALGVPPTPGPVVRVPAPGPAEALAWQQRCLAAGVRVGCFRPPSVPRDGSCLRLTARADLTAEQLEHAACVVLTERPA